MSPSIKFNIMIVAYLRISTDKQHLKNQQDEILRFAASKNLTINSWVTEVVSGQQHQENRKLGALLRRMNKGDTLIVTEISRLSRTLIDIMAIMGKCLSRDINLYATKEGYYFDNSVNSKILCFAFGLVAELERTLISMRTKEALAARKASGMRLGRRVGSYTKRRILIDNRQEVIGMIRAGKNIKEICNSYGVSRDTFARFCNACPSVRKALEETRKNK